MSIETKWTPGDWSLSYDTGSTRDVVAHPDPKPVCTVKQGWVTREQYAANAQLIASAPKLYEALYQVLTVANLRDHPAIAEMARAALASARGEG